MVVTVLDPRRHEVRIVNAGHLPPLWCRGPGSVVAVADDETGLPLGVEPDVDYAQCVLSLEPGDSLSSTPTASPRP